MQLDVIICLAHHEALATKNEDKIYIIRPQNLLQFLTISISNPTGISNMSICKASYDFQSPWTARKSKQIGNQRQAAKSIKIKLTKLI